MEYTDEDIEDAMSESHLHEVTATVAIFQLKPYRNETEHNFLFRVTRAMCYVGMEEEVTPYSAGQALRGYMSVQ